MTHIYTGKPARIWRTRQQKLTSPGTHNNYFKNSTPGKKKHAPAAHCLTGGAQYRPLERTWF
jgi:hypothetical protein